MEYLIPRKLWVSMANHQLERRKKIFGEQVKVCEGCTEILTCDGPVSFQICKTMDEMVETGMLETISPKGWRMKVYPFNKLRRKYLPVSDSCLNVYGLTVKDNKVLVADKE